MTHKRMGELPVVDKPHLSPSSIDMFCRCPESWRRRYIEKERQPPALAMHKGKAFHAAVDHNMKQKIDSHTDLLVPDIIEAGVAEIHSLIDGEGFEARPTEDGLAKSVACDKAVDSVAALVRSHATNQAPDYQPTKVEEPFRIELPTCDHDLLGFKDFVGTLTDPDYAGVTVVTDWKSAGRKPNAGTEHDSVQLTSYAASEMMLDSSLDVVTVRLDVIVDRAKTYPRHVMESQRDADDVRALAFRIDVVSKSITAGLFPPAVPGSWWCSPGWCGYWNTCKYVNAERRQKAEAHAKVEEAIAILEVEKEVPF